MLILFHATNSTIIPSRSFFQIFITSMSDHDRISPHIFNTKSIRQVMWIKKVSVRGLLVDPLQNSLKRHKKNCMADSEECYQWDLGSERVINYKFIIQNITAWTHSITSNASKLLDKAKKVITNYNCHLCLAKPSDCFKTNALVPSSYYSNPSIQIRNHCIQENLIKWNIN